MCTVDMPRIGGRLERTFCLQDASVSIRTFIKGPGPDKQHSEKGMAHGERDVHCMESKQLCKLSGSLLFPPSYLKK